MGSSEFHWEPCLIGAFEFLRAKIGGKPLIITSGFRCPSYNYKIKGAKNSCHTYGSALDIKAPPGVGMIEFADAARLALVVYAPGGGLGIYIAKRVIHMDTGRGHPPNREWTEGDQIGLSIAEKRERVWEEDV
jgi:uncharacterized protein YcbK (DUF882 family)